jgi:hypothetical protein
VFAKYLRRQAPETLQLKPELRQELTYRLIAIPAALIGARLLVSVAPFLTRILTMLVHECGHAITAWLCGFWAVPGLWFTPISPDRVFWITVAVAGVVAFGACQFWRFRRWKFVAAAAFILILQARLTLLPLDQANALIAFGGDGGSIVLGTVLMSTFYVSRSSKIYENSLRWGFLGIGAIAFMDAFSVWTGPRENIEFGEMGEGRPTDPSLMVDHYGWGISQMVERYVGLGILCLTILGLVYVIGILSVQKDSRSVSANAG